MFIQSLATYIGAEQEHNVPPGAVAMMLVQLSEADPVHTYVRVIEHFPQGAATGRGTYGAQGQHWFKGEIIPLWSRDSGRNEFDSRVQRIALQQRGGGLVGTRGLPVQVCWLTRKDMLDAFRYTPGERYQTWDMEGFELPDNILTGVGDEWDEKNWIRVPCRGMRSGALVFTPTFANGSYQKFCGSIAQVYEPSERGTDDYVRRSAVVPIFIAPGPLNMEDDEGAFKFVLPFDCDPNAHELVVRAWELLSASGAAPDAKLMLSSRPLDNQHKKTTGSAHLVSTGTATNSNIIAWCANQFPRQAQSAACVLWNQHGANAVDWRLSYCVNLGLDNGRDQVLTNVVASGNLAAGATVWQVGTDSPWEAAMLHCWTAGGAVAMDVSTAVKMHL